MSSLWRLLLQCNRWDFNPKILPVLRRGMQKSYLSVVPIQLNARNERKKVCNKHNVSVAYVAYVACVGWKLETTLYSYAWWWAFARYILLHWRRQLWCTGTRAPSTSKCLIFQVTSQPHKLWHSTPSGCLCKNTSIAYSAYSFVTVYCTNFRIFFFLALKLLLPSGSDGSIVFSIVAKFFRSFQHNNPWTAAFSLMKFCINMYLENLYKPIAYQGYRSKVKVT